MNQNFFRYFFKLPDIFCDKICCALYTRYTFFFRFTLSKTGCLLHTSAHYIRINSIDLQTLKDIRKRAIKPNLFRFRLLVTAYKVKSSDKTRTGGMLLFSFLLTFNLLHIINAWENSVRKEVYDWNKYTLKFRSGKTK